MAAEKGRCAGCGRVGILSATRRHTAACPDFAELYRTDRARALDPAAEQARWLRTEGSAESKVVDKTARVAAVFARRDEVATRYNARWDTPADPLAD